MPIVRPISYCCGVVRNDGVDVWARSDGPANTSVQNIQVWAKDLPAALRQAERTIGSRRLLVVTPRQEVGPCPT